MPQFNAYPALQARTFDIQDIQRRSLQNQLLGSKLQQAQGEAQRQGQLRGVMPGVGAEAGLGPNAQQALAIDPSQLSALMKIPKAERDRAKERAGTLGNLALGVLTAPVAQRAAMWPQARESAIASGANPQNVPEAYDQGTEQKLRQWVAQAGQIKTLLDQVPDAPSGYRGAGDGLEAIPGGPADPAQVGRLAEAKSRGGGLTVAQRRENAEIKQARAALDREGLSHEDVMRISKSQKDTGRDNPEYSPFINSRVRQATRRKYGDDPEYVATYGRYLTPAPEFSDPAGMRPLPPGVSAEQPGILDRVGDFLGFGDDGDPRGPTPGGPENAARGGPRRGNPRGGRFGPRGRGGTNAIPNMSAAEIKNLVDTKGESLTPAERTAIQARLDALGM